MQVYIGLFSKKINSTAQLPDTDGFISMNCQVKEPSSILNPRLIIDIDNWNPNLNYAYIPNWSRYYFIHNSTVMLGHQVELDLAVDVLGTYRTAILDSTAFVRRSASNYNLKLPDDTWSHTTDYNLYTDFINCGMNAAGDFLLFTVSNAPSNVIPSQSVYICTAAQLKQVIEYLLSDTFYNAYSADLDATTGALSKTFFNPFQYITKCMFVPFNASGPGQYGPDGDPWFQNLTSSTIHFGWWDSGISAPLVGTFGRRFYKTFTLGTYSKWTDRDSEWTQNELFMPGIGTFNISPEYQGQDIVMEYLIDFSNGSATLKIFVSGGTNSHNDDHLIQALDGKIGCDIQLSGLYEDLVGDTTTMSGLVGKGLKALAGGLMGAVNTSIDLFKGSSLSDIMSNTAPLASAVVQGASSGLQPTMSQIGSSGNRAAVAWGAGGRLTIRKYQEYDSVRSRLGYMCMKTLPLSGLSGYTEVVNPSVETIGTSGEDSMINGFLSGGFYIE